MSLCRRAKRKALLERARREVPGLRKKTAENIKAVRKTIGR